MENLVDHIKKVKRNNIHIYGLILFVLIYDSYLECVGRFDGYICTLCLSLFILSISTIAITGKVRKVQYTLNGMLFASSIMSLFLSIFIVSITSVLNYAFVYHPYLFFTFTLFLSLYFLLSYVVWKYLFAYNLFSWAINIRIIILTIDIILLVIYLLCYYLFINERGTIKPSSLYDFARLFCVFFFIWLFLLFFFSLWENVRYSFLRGEMHGKKYVLFLRCFKFDRVDVYEDVLTSLSSVFKKEYDVLQIGNPKNILKGYYMCDTFYLPSEDWQSAVRNYIINAEIVFLVLDQTNGVLWEMLHHTEQKEKYIYYIPLNTNIEKLISNDLMLNEYKKGNPIAKQMISWKNDLSENSFFFFRRETMHLSTNIFSLIIDYAQQYELHDEEEIISRCSKFREVPPYHIKQVDVFSLIVNGDFHSAYNHIEKRFLVPECELPNV